ncbi:MAG TPA: DegT/DnrJ/EryC1/StrS family aminotransferase [Thermoanaerobaculia bacterium]|nr:DegT/DnrJ/EryC1/StrS family aminotransferase [Thermoanaerobaculia bacterium]
MIDISLPSDQDASGRSFGEEELALLAQVLRSGTLTSTRGTMVRGLEHRFAETLGVRHALACSSGTAAFHTAVAAVDPEPGDEIVTSPITDMGAISPILYQGAIPVFADVDPATCNVTAATIEPCLGERTRAIVVTHLFGNPCDMGPILELARSRGIPVIEDCAQSFLARDQGRMAGTMGTLGVFSLQQGKHVTCGEGGLVVTQDDALARRMFLFVNKAWGYGEPAPDHTFLALNYRLSELQGAVALAQLPRLESFVERRIANASRLDGTLRNLPGIATPLVRAGSVHSYWRYCLRVDPAIVPGGAVALGAQLQRKGIAAAPRYIQKPAFECAVFQRQQTFGQSRWPFTLARPEVLDFRRSRFPGVSEALDRILVLPWNERFEPGHLDFLAESIHEAAGHLVQEAA